MADEWLTIALAYAENAWICNNFDRCDMFGTSHNLRTQPGLHGRMYKKNHRLLRLRRHTHLESGMRREWQKSVIANRRNRKFQEFEQVQGVVQENRDVIVE
jgi:hypothetical protein